MIKIQSKTGNLKLIETNNGFSVFFRDKNISKLIDKNKISILLEKMKEQGLSDFLSRIEEQGNFINAYEYLVSKAKQYEEVYEALEIDFEPKENFDDDITEEDILQLLTKKGLSTIKEMIDSGVVTSQPTAFRRLSNLIKKGLVEKKGKGSKTFYMLSEYQLKRYRLLNTNLLNVDEYLKKSQKERMIQLRYNEELITELIDLFSIEEKEKLGKIKEIFKTNYGNSSQTNIKRFYEQTIIDLSFGSSKLEGNTYSILETELLIKNKIEAKGKKKNETTMILNHKEGIEFILSKTKNLDQINTDFIVELHSILSKDFEGESFIGQGIREGRVGITGTEYVPIVGKEKIIKELEKICNHLNSLKDDFEKAMIAMIMISYLQPFDDGNKRTGRILANGFLIKGGYFPLTFAYDKDFSYIKSVIMFYEQNNILPLKNFFLKNQLDRASE